MGCWSPLNAMKAYMHTLQLVSNNSKLLEPECIEYVSALAAGNQARLMVDVPSNGFSPSTLALAIAARYTGGHLICACHDPESLRQAKSQIEDFKLGDVVSFEGGDPCQVIKKYKNVDFAVVDHRIKEGKDVLLAMDMNPEESVLVVSNLFRRSNSASVRASFAHTKNDCSRIESTILPIGDGMEVTKIGAFGGNRTRSKRSKRTFLVYEERK